MYAPLDESYNIAHIIFNSIQLEKEPDRVKYSELESVGKDTEIEIEAYFCVSKGFPDLKSLVLDPNTYKAGVRKFKLSELHTTSLTKVYASVWSTNDLVGIIHVVNGQNNPPFFVPKLKAERLKHLITISKVKEDVVRL